MDTSKRQVRISQGILGLLFIGSMLLLTSGILNEVKLSAIKKHGKIAQGKVISAGELEKPQGAKTHFLQVGFRDDGGNDISKSFPVDRDDFEHATKTGTVPVTYVPSKPGYSTIGHQYGYNRGPLFIAIAGALATLFGIFVLEKRYRKV